MDSARRVTLDDVAELSGGFAFKSEQYVDSGRFVLRTVNIQDDASITRDGAVFISEDDARNFGRFALQEHDTLFVMVAATLGKVGYVRKRDLPALLNQNMWVIRAKPGRVDPVFLHYQFRELSKIPLAWVSGSARSFLRRDDVRTLKFVLPDQRTQLLIGKLLKALDDKIELNRRMNETLEAMARAIFKDWFVDFGPTRAKTEGRAPYLAPDIWSLFPDRLDAEGKPEGWTVVPLSALVDVNPSEQLARGKLAPYLEMASIPTEGPIPAPHVVREFGSGMRFRNGDALLARITPCLENGKTAFVQNLPEGEVGWGSTEFIVLRARPPMPKPVAYLVARDPAFRANAIRSMTGTSGRQRASNDAISAYPLAKPDEDELWDRLHDLIVPMFKRIAANGKENETLAATRDLLLPKLMSGEIRVRDAEKAIEVAP
jgi:type I restriction enzyme S subunit